MTLDEIIERRKAFQEVFNEVMTHIAELYPSPRAIAAVTGLNKTTLYDLAGGHALPSPRTLRALQGIVSREDALALYDAAGLPVPADLAAGDCPSWCGLASAIADYLGVSKDVAVAQAVSAYAQGIPALRAELPL